MKSNMATLFLLRPYVRIISDEILLDKHPYDVKYIHRTDAGASVRFLFYGAIVKRLRHRTFNPGMRVRLPLASLYVPVAKW